MSVWDRLIHLTSASPFSGTWMSLATGIGGLAAVLLFRRLIPATEDRNRGSATLVFLSVGVMLGLVRLLFVATGAQEATAGKAISVLTTFFVAMGAVNAVVMLVFEVMPSRVRIQPPSILRDVVQMLAFVVIVFGALGQAGITNVTSLITTSAVLTAVVGLALQSTIANLFAGIVLHMDSSLGVGDWVQLGTRMGRISQIRWRSTLLRTLDGDLLIIPNGHMTAQEVYNYSRPAARHRVWLRIGFHYRHPPNDVRPVLKEAAMATPGVLASPPPDCMPVEFGDSAVVYAVRFWIDEVGRQADIEGEVRTRIWYGAQRAELEIPYPMRTVTLHQASDVRAAEPDQMDRLLALERVELFSPFERHER